MQQERFEQILSDIFYASSSDKMCLKICLERFSLVGKHFKKLNCEISPADFSRNWYTLLERIRGEKIHAFQLNRINGEILLEQTIVGTDYGWTPELLRLNEDFFRTGLLLNHV